MKNDKGKISSNERMKGQSWQLGQSVPSAKSGSNIKGTPSKAQGPRQSKKGY